jgi:hypothetical protein
MCIVSDCEYKIRTHSPIASRVHPLCLLAPPMIDGLAGDDIYSIVLLRRPLHFYCSNKTLAYSHCLGLHTNNK